MASRIEVTQPSLAKPGRHRLMIIALAIALAGGSVSLWFLFQSRTTPPSAAPTPKVEAVNAVAALGRLEPHGEVIRISAPMYSEGARVGELRV